MAVAHRTGSRVAMTENSENGEPHGLGVLTLQSARYEGEFRNGKPYGSGTVTNLEGVFKGNWKDGCLVGDRRKVSFAVPSSTCR